MPKLRSPRPVDLTRPFNLNIPIGSQSVFDVSSGLVSWYRDVDGDFVPDLTGRGNTLRRSGLTNQATVPQWSGVPSRESLGISLNSFDFTFNATSPTNVEFLTTVNDSGSPGIKQDHLFGLGDFTISFWYYPTNTPVQQTIIAKNVSGTPSPALFNEFFVYLDAAFRINIELTDVDGDRRIIRANTSLPFNRWHHVCISYVASSLTCNFTINGTPFAKTSTDPDPNPYNYGLNSTSTPLTIGARWSNGIFTQAAFGDDARGYIYEVAIWKGRALSSLEASAIRAAVIFGVGDPRSGFISPPPRVLLQQRDAELNKNPSSDDVVVRRPKVVVSNAENNKFNSLLIRTASPQFNDSNAIDFTTQPVVFPAMLPAPTTYSDSLLPAALNMIGAESDIKVTLPIRSHQQPEHITRTQAGFIAPFDDSGAIDSNSEYFASGTSESTLPGFTEPLWSKVKIEIELSSSGESLITRNLTSETGPVSIPGIGNPGDKTGFNYYNFRTGIWEDIGLRNPVDESSLPFKLLVTESSPGVFSTEGLMSQFHGGNCYPYTRLEKTSSGDVINISDIPTDTENLINAFTNIIISNLAGFTPALSCTPGNHASAPGHPKYFATSSNILRLNDYIKSPFLLEKAVVEFANIDVRQKIPASTGSLGYQYMHVQDNYIFFMYRQTNVPSSVARSLSKRSIILSGAMTFASPLTTYTIRNDSPQNSFSPEFLHEFDTSTVTIPNSIDNRFTGSIRLECIPGSSPIRNFSTNPLPAESSTGFTGSMPVGHPWSGGVTAKSLPASDIDFLCEYGNWHLGTGSIAQERRKQVLFNSANYDARALKMLGGFNQIDDVTEDDFVSLFNSWISGDPSGINAGIPLSENSPYLLLPGDDIIFGIESGYSRPMINPNNADIVDKQSTLSLLPSSSMLIQPGMNKITLYGSVLRNSQPISNINSTNISSPAVHYVIGDEKVLDQFELDFTESYFGSYLDQIVTGSMATASRDGKTVSVPSDSNLRKIVSRVSLGQAGITGSLQRFVNISDTAERIYDSCLPSYQIFLSGTSVLRVNSQLNEYGHEEIRSTVDNPVSLINRLSEATGQYFKQFPFEAGPFRQYGTRRREVFGAATYPTGSSGRRIPIAIDDSGKKPSELSAYNIPKLKELIFTTRWIYQVTELTNGLVFNKTIMNRAGDISTSQIRGVRKGTYRYGLSNIEPEYSSVRWRANHYGFMRDMLEQRRDTAFFRKDQLDPPVKCTFFSGSTIVAPELTHSQNISVYSTSSLPFFDEAQKTTYRYDDPDESLVEI